MSKLDRLSFASRVFCLAAVLGLSLVSRDPEALRGTALLVAVGALGALVARWQQPPRWFSPALEAVLVGVVVGSALPGGISLLPYLLVPALIAGLVAGLRAAIAATLVECLLLTVLSLLLPGGLGLDEVSEVALPWMLAALGVGLLGGWMRRLRVAPAPTTDPSYESARRLLTQLRTVTRRLSSGLDTVGLSAQVLATVQDSLGPTRSAVFVRTEGGVLAPLGFRGLDARDVLVTDHPVVDRCWTEMEPASGITTSGLAARRYRVAIPLRVGSRMLGVVVCDCAEQPASTTLREMMPTVDEQAMRLEAALAFDEVRTLATSEERHRLAREIHDGVAQEIASLGYSVDELMAGATSPTQEQRLRSLRAELTRVVTELRLSIFDLRSEVNPSAGLGSAISDYVRAVGARSPLTVHLTLSEEPTRLRSDVETELLRIAQEAVTNARKHSGALNLWVDCRISPPFARVTIRDDGTGNVRPRENSYGLKIMRERASRIDAQLEIRSGDAGDQSRPGTTVVVTVGSNTSASPMHREDAS